MKRETEPGKERMEEESVMELGSGFFLLNLSEQPTEFFVRAKKLFVSLREPPRDHICGVDICSSGRVEAHLIRPICIKVGSKET